MTILLGGTANHIGSVVHFIEAPADACLAAFSKTFAEFRDDGQAKAGSYQRREMTLEQSRENFF
jgi:hypothetical protein